MDRAGWSAADISRLQHCLAGGAPVVDGVEVSTLPSASAMLYLGSRDCALRSKKSRFSPILFSALMTRACEVRCSLPAPRTSISTPCTACDSPRQESGRKSAAVAGSAAYGSRWISPPIAGERAWCSVLESQHSALCHACSAGREAAGTFRHCPFVGGPRWPPAQWIPSAGRHLSVEDQRAIGSAERLPHRARHAPRERRANRVGARLLLRRRVGRPGYSVECGRSGHGRFHMARFYQALLRDKLPPSAALRRAQNEIRKDGRWSDPFYWSGFSLIGG